MKTEEKRTGECGILEPYFDNLMPAMPVYSGEEILSRCSCDKEGADEIAEYSEKCGCALLLPGHDRSTEEQTALFRMIYRYLGSAGAKNTVTALIPAVVLPSELEQVRRWASGARAELDSAGIPCGRLSAGVVVSTPSSAILADLLAPMSDFFVFDSAGMMRCIQNGCGCGGMKKYSGDRERDNASAEIAERCLRMTSAAARREGIGVYTIRKRSD